VSDFACQDSIEKCHNCIVRIALDLSHRRYVSGIRVHTVMNRLTVIESHRPLTSRKRVNTMTLCSTFEHRACTTQRPTTMLPESGSGSTVPHAEPTNPYDASRRKKRLSKECDLAASFFLQAPHISRPGTFPYLPPEIRNRIYALLFNDSADLVVMAAEGSRRQFKLPRLHDQYRYDALIAQRAYYVASGLPTETPASHALAPDQLRLEARTYFYARQRFRIVADGYEYLPLYVRWLDAIGIECRGYLPSVVFVGCMWRRTSKSLTTQFHTLLQDCRCLTSLTVQLDIRHVFEDSLKELDLLFQHPEGAIGRETVPQLDLVSWAETVAKLWSLKTFALQLVIGINQTQEVHNGQSEESERRKGEWIAKGVERQFIEQLLRMSDRNETVVEVNFFGREEEEYRGLPWSEQLPQCRS
jgi:hypothetical protein